ncbi:5573_t:CDS:2, partial [Gigaspora rosea]
RDSNILVSKSASFDPRIVEMNVGDEVVYLILDERFAYIRLFQQVEKNQSKIELHDVSIRMRFTSYRNTNRESRIRLLTGVNNNVLTHTQITPLRESFIFKVFIVEVCDRDTALNRNPTIGDIIVDGDIQYLKFREYLNPVLATEIEISCDGCQFQHHEIVMYYLNWMYEYKRLKKEADPIKFGKNFSTRDGNSDEEYYNYLLIVLAKITSQMENKDFNRLREKIKSTFDLELLQEGGKIDLEIQNSNLSETQQGHLQTLRLNQEKM